MINYQGPICSTGYGVVSYNIWREMRKLTDVTLWPIGNQVQLLTQAYDASDLNDDIVKQENFNHSHPSLKVWHENHLAERIGNGPMYAYPFFEINKFDERRKNHLKSVDHLFVSSQWAKDIILDQTALRDDEVTIAPCGVDTNIFSPTSQYNEQKCIFFNCGKWEIRKGHDILIRAFKDAFPNELERVELWMMTENPFLNNSEKAYWHNMMQVDNRIKHITKVQYQEQLAQVMNQTFCGVFPAKAEGWNLELLEMMSCGKHVIATNYSAHTEFCNNKNCHLINITEEEPAYDGKWFDGNCGTWASLENEAYDELVSHLQYMYQVWLQNPRSQNEIGITTAREFSWDKTAKIIWEKINE